MPEPSFQAARTALEACAARHAAVAPPDVTHVYLRQVGELRTKPGGRWMPFRATQSLAVDRVAFQWRARLRVARVVPIVVTDAYDGASGAASVRLAGIVPLRRAAGPTIDQAQVQRYLAETAWNPLAFARVAGLRFAAGEGGSVRVGWGPSAAHVDLSCDSEGRIVRTFTRTRPYDGGVPAPWEGRYLSYGDLGGYPVPREAEVTWHLEDGPFTCWRGRVTSYALR
ncbi:MAG: DUF6544 family protein [Planctomycetota bacterium]